MQLTKNFAKSEFDSKDGEEMPTEVFYNIQKLANQLQYVRDYLDRPIRINSGYRSLNHNLVIGGSKNSQHLLGKAADIVVKGLEPKLVYEILEDLINKGEILQGGLGLYDSFVHYDFGFKGKRRRWDHRKTKARW
jgi:uncharacterized protein YcbK (DUF882 family)